MEKVFVDTDIIIDLLAQREPFHKAASRLFSKADIRQVKVYVSSLTFANLHYLLSRAFNETQARKMLLKFKTLVTVLSVDDKIIDLALSSDFKDFEDGIQYFTAIENNLTVLITRNIKDYKYAEISVLTADQYLKR